MKLHKKGKWFLSFTTNKAWHLFAVHASLHWYLHKQVPARPWKHRTRLGPFEYEYTLHKGK